MNQEMQFIIDTFNKEETFAYTPVEIIGIIQDASALPEPLQQTLSLVLNMSPRYRESQMQLLEEERKEEVILYFPYLVELSFETRHPFIKTKLSDFLWRIHGWEDVTISNDEKLTLSKQAYNGYTALFQSQFSQLMLEEHQNYTAEVINNLADAIFFLCKGNNTKIKEFVSMVENSLNQLQPENGNHIGFFENYTHGLLIHHAYFDHHVKFFKQQSTLFIAYSAFCLTYRDYLLKNDQYDSAIEFCRLVSEAMKHQSNQPLYDEWKVKMAEVILEYALKSSTDSFYHHALLLESSSIFKSKNMTEKYEQALYRYEQLSKKISLPHNEKMSESQEEIQTMSASYAHYLCEKYTPLEVLRSFSMGYPYQSFNDDIIKFPSAQKTKTSSEEALKAYPLSTFLTKQQVNEKGHTIKSYTGDTASWSFFASMYKSQLNTLQILFHHCITRMIHYNSLTPDVMVEHFLSNSWFTSTLLQEQYIEGVYVPSHVEKLKPIFDNYLANKTAGAPNYMLVIDSLAPKFEGLLRDVLSYHQKPTINVMEDKTNGTFFTTEKDITALLRTQTIKEVLSEDDHFLLTFVLVDKGGFNLRHNVSHALLHQYHELYADMLILCLLRLSKYVIQTEGACALPVARENELQK